MLIRLWRYIRGYLRIRITGSGTERFINGCRHRNIRLWNLQAVNGAYEVNMFVCDFKKLKTILRKTGTKVTIVKRIGLPFFLFRYRRRKLFFTGCVLCFALLVMLTRFIWDIDLSGNQIYTREQILHYLENNKVHTGMVKSKVNCSQIAADLRRNYKNIIWVSASIDGNRLCIRVRENMDAYRSKTKKQRENRKEKAVYPYDLVADTDGVITEIVPREGIPRIRKGKKVRKGQVLVSGQVPVKDDSQTVIDYQYHRADADIKAEVKILYKEVLVNSYMKKVYGTIKKKEDYIRIADWQFQTGDIFPEKQTEQTKKQEIYITNHPLCLFDRIKLPVSYGTKTTVFYRISQKNHTTKEKQQLLSHTFSQYCRDLEKKGVEILENDVKIYTGSRNASARGTITAVRSIGVLRPSKIKKIPRNSKSQQGENIDGHDGNSH